MGIYLRSKRIFARPYLKLIALFGVIVPRRLRADWRQEWEAELRHRETLLAEWERLGWRGKIDLSWRSTSAFWDALWLQSKRLENEMIQDIRFAIRMLFKHKGFTSIAVITLALGIGANTAIFSVVNAVLIKSLPYQEPDRIFQVLRKFPTSEGESFSTTKFRFYQKHTQTFERMAAFSGWIGSGLNLTAGDETHFVESLSVSADFFPVLGTPPLLGRTFGEAEDRPGGERVIVIAHSLWKRLFNSDQQFIGRSVLLGGESHTVVGIMPPGFQTNPPAEVWMPLRAVFDPADRGNNFLVIGRTRPGITQEKAQADLNMVLGSMRTDYPIHVGDNESVMVARYQDRLVGDMKLPLLLLLCAVGFVLLIACANVANLLLSRAAARSKEMSVRAALGAGRLRLARQLLTESLLMAVAGAALGLLLAHLGLNFLIAMIPDSLPRASEIGIDPTVLLFTLGVAALAGVLFGLAPILDAGRLNLANALREGSGRTTGAASRSRLRNLLVAFEIALSLVLLVGAALLLRTFANLRNEKLGFDPQNVVTMKLSLSDPRYQSTAETDRFLRQVFERLKQISGVESAAYITTLPTEVCPDLPFKIEGRGQDAFGSANYKHITPDYLRTMNIPLRRGRQFDERDSENARGVAIVNESFVRTYFPNEDPIGRQITIGANIGPDYADRTREIVGVAGDMRELAIDLPAQPIMFTPLAQRTDRLTGLTNRLAPASIVIKLRGNPTSMEPAVRAAVRTANAMQSVSHLRTMEDVLSWSLGRQRFNMLLLAIFAGVALLLSAVGIYGVMSYTVQQRTNEIGIRMALGAQARSVLWLIIRQGLALSVIGVVIGLAGALALTRVMQGLLFGVSATDPASFAGIALLLIIVASVACYIPARRATKVDPLVALRIE